jgi:hypothetical protein
MRVRAVPPPFLRRLVRAARIKRVLSRRGGLKDAMYEATSRRREVCGRREVRDWYLVALLFNRLAFVGGLVLEVEVELRGERIVGTRALSS